VRLLEGLVELIAPTRCAGCELPGALLCAGCDTDLPRVEPHYACPACGAPFGGLVCTECWSTEFAFEAAIAFGELDGALARAVVLHKDAGERRLGSLLGGLLAEQVAARWGGWPDALTWIPPTRAAIARRGFDHGLALARPVAGALSVGCLPLLARARARDQRVLGRSARAANAGGSFTASLAAPTSGPPASPPARVLVVDDVMTTGATLDAAAATLLAAGVSAVRVAVVARAW
jgi:predicted amidophosphoribosyltransferase